MAIQTAVTRGREETHCQEVTPTLISRRVIQPEFQGLPAQGIERAEYRVGISGCGNRNMFIVVCSEDTDTCFAGASEPFQD